MSDFNKMNVFDRVNYIKKTIAKVEKEIAEEPMSKKVRTNWGLVIKNKMMPDTPVITYSIVKDSHANGGD